MLLDGSFVGMKSPGKKTIVKVGPDGLQVVIILCREHEMSEDVACLDIAPAPGESIYVSLMEDAWRSTGASLSVSRVLSPTRIRTAWSSK